jgi:hypothetical protein
VITKVVTHNRSPTPTEWSRPDQKASRWNKVRPMGQQLIGHHSAIPSRRLGECMLGWIERVAHGRRNTPCQLVNPLWK